MCFLLREYHLSPLQKQEDHHTIVVVEDITKTVTQVIFLKKLNTGGIITSK